MRMRSRFYDKIIYFNYIEASQSKKAVHATSVLKFNGISLAPAVALRIAVDHSVFEADEIGCVILSLGN